LAIDDGKYQGQRAVQVELSSPTGGVSIELGLRRCLGKPDLYAKIVRRYLAQGDEACRIRTALEAGDADRASNGAHSLVSTAGTIGATALSETARALQLAIDAGETARVPALLDVLEQEAAIVDEALREWLAGKAQADELLAKAARAD